MAACSSSDPSEATFCPEIDALRVNNPFASRPVATPEEMRSSFARLRSAAVAIAAAAPSPARPQADRYVDAIDGLIAILSPAGYRPADVDRFAYANATADYEAAATSLDNAADHACPDGAPEGAG